jgi:hypothetical protein
LFNTRIARRREGFEGRGEVKRIVEVMVEGRGRERRRCVMTLKDRQQSSGSEKPRPNN